MLKKSFRGLATQATSTASRLATKDSTSITPPYKDLLNKLDNVRNVLGSSRRLTLAEKILYSHLYNPEESLGGNRSNIRGQAYLKLKPDRVAMQGSFMFIFFDKKYLINNFRCFRSNGFITIYDLWITNYSCTFIYTL